MKKLSELKQLGFEGTDKTLSISLDEYGLAWTTNPDQPNDFHFCFKQPNGKFVWGFYFAKDTDAQKEFNWVDWPAFLSTMGMTQKEWNQLSLPQKISDLINYYGTENVMGSAYQEGWEIDWEN